MKFSIIVPVYNIEDKIFRCLESIKNQTFTDFEVLVVIDGATDGSEKICRIFEREDSRIKVITKENGGLVSARKCGAELVGGDYIVNVDGDDFVEKCYLQEMKKLIDQYSPDMIACGYQEVTDHKHIYTNVLKAGYYEIDKLETIRDGIIYDKKQKGFKGGLLINTIWTKIVKKEIYLKCQRCVPNYITVGEDLILNACLMNQIQSLYVSANAYYNYMVYNSSMMHQYNVKNIGHYLDVAKELGKISFIAKSDINVYLLQAYISEIRKIAKNCQTYSEFKAVLKSIPELEILWENANRAVIINKDIESYVKMFLVKTKNDFLLYYLCKRL